MQERTMTQERTMSVVDWLITLFILSVPIVGVVFALVWARGGGGANIAKQNFSRAMIVWFILATLLYPFINWGNLFGSP